MRSNHCLHACVLRENYSLENNEEGSASAPVSVILSLPSPPFLRSRSIRLRISEPQDLTAAHAIRTTRNTRRQKYKKNAPSRLNERVSFFFRENPISLSGQCLVNAKLTRSHKINNYSHVTDPYRIQKDQISATERTARMPHAESKQTGFRSIIREKRNCMT